MTEGCKLAFLTCTVMSIMVIINKRLIKTDY